MVCSKRLNIVLALVLVLMSFSKLASAGEQSLAESLKVKKALVGRYAHYDVVAYVAKVPLGQMRSLVITYGFSDFELEGDQLSESETFCHAEYKSNLPMQSQVADSFTQAILPSSAVVQVSEIEGKWRVFRPETPTPIGIEIGATELFPTDPKDPRIRDDDNDQRPGVSVDLKLFGIFKAQIYLARRERFAYEMTWMADGRLQGIVHDSSEQLVLGATHHMLKKQMKTEQHPDRNLSPIVLLPLVEAYDCARLMRERDLLFPAEPEIW
jgi:hypothetical protein